MIPATELRIGNWVLEQSNKIGLGKIKPFKIKVVTKQEEHKWEPIPITPELLEKCGFEYEDMGDDSPYERWICKDYEELWVWDFHGDEWLFCLGDSFEQGGYHYLHQLQNLYHSLTNKELNIVL